MIPLCQQIFLDALPLRDRQRAGVHDNLGDIPIILIARAGVALSDDTIDRRDRQPRRACAAGDLGAVEQQRMSRRAIEDAFGQA